MEGLLKPWFTNLNKNRRIAQTQSLILVNHSLNPILSQASTLGSLEALLEFLKSPDVNIPVSGINIGPVHKKDVMRASVMLERKRKEFACILAFDVKVTPEARDMAEELGVKVFTADIIYHLFDQVSAALTSSWGRSTKSLVCFGRFFSF